MPATLDFRTLFDRSPNASALVGPDGDIVEDNAAYRAVFGRGDSGSALPADGTEEAERMRASVEQVFASGEGDTLTLLLPAAAPDGSGGAATDGVWTFTHTPIPGPDGTVTVVLRHASEAAAAHAAALRASADALRMSQARLRAVVDQMAVGIVQADLGGRVTAVNVRFAEMTGRPDTELIGQSLAALIAPDDDPGRAGGDDPDADGDAVGDLGTLLATAARGGDGGIVEQPLARPDGSRVWVRASASGIRDASTDAVRSLVAVCFDVTAEREAVRAAAASLREGTAMLRTLIANLPDIVVYQSVRSADGAMRFTYLSDGVERLHGISAAAAIADSSLLYRQVLPSHIPVLAATEERVLRTGEPFVVEVPFTHPDGTVRWIRIASTPRETADGTTVWEGAEVDVTAARVAEAALRESETRARVALDIASVGVYDWDIGSGSAILDARACHILGIPADTPAAAIPRLVYASVHEDDRARVREAFAAGRSGDGAWHIENRVVHPDGSVRHVVSRGRFDIAGVDGAQRGTRLVGALLDVTAERAADASLRESEARFRHLADSVPQLVWIADADGSIGWYNGRWYAYTGTTLEQMQGWGWQAVHHPDHVEAVTDKFRRHVASGEVWEDTFPIRGRDGQYRWFLSRAHPIFGADGQVLRWFGTNTDITEQREAAAALRDLNEALEARVAERTAALATANAQLGARNRELQDFAHVASHDLQEPLRKIQSFASLLAADEGDALSDDGRHYITRTQAAAERMSGLIRDLLAFSRVATQQQPAEPVDLDATLAAVLGDLDLRVAQTGGAVEAGVLGTIVADPVQMRQLFQNLVGNALKYHRPDEAPVVRVSAHRTADAMRLVVSDNGIGFDPRHAERIFAPFQRLHGKGEYEGTGMGLAIVRRIAERHGGTVEATSTPGIGSRFVVTLPLG